MEDKSPASQPSTVWEFPVHLLATTKQSDPSHGEKVITTVKKYREEMSKRCTPVADNAKYIGVILIGEVQVWKKAFGQYITAQDAEVSVAPGLPWQCIQQFWLYYRSTKLPIVLKYGLPPVIVENLPQDVLGYYRDQKFEKYFDNFVELDTAEFADYPLAITFHYGRVEGRGDEIFTIYRTRPKDNHNGRFICAAATLSEPTSIAVMVSSMSKKAGKNSIFISYAVAIELASRLAAPIEEDGANECIDDIPVERKLCMTLHDISARKLSQNILQDNEMDEGEADVNEDANDCDMAGTNGDSLHDPSVTVEQLDRELEEYARVRDIVKNRKHSPTEK